MNVEGTKRGAELMKIRNFAGCERGREPAWVENKQGEKLDRAGKLDRVEEQQEVCRVIPCLPREQD